MITLSLIKSSGGVAQYYAKEDNYYLSEADAKESSLWLGKGAEELGLSGKVEEKELQKLLEGKLPNGTTIGLQKDGKINHRAGYDICFHAPKSVSILALDGEDRRFYDAHLDAVKETLKIIERDCAQSKVFKNEQIKFENTKNLAVALVRHTSSREMDPHLHHHALVMNATKRQDNAWRALASSKVKTSGAVNGFFERVHNNQIYYGLIYKSSLANKVINLGCEIETVGRHGLWEIKGVPKEAREVMSKRRQQIEERIDKLNYRSMKAADVAALDTRKRKPKDLKLNEIKQLWKNELASVGFSTKEFITGLDKNRSEAEKTGADEKHALEESGSIATNAKEAIMDSIEHLSQYNLKLDYAKIISQALEFSIGKNTHSDMVKALDKTVKKGGIIPLDKSASMFVTKELIETEKSVMDLVARGKETKEQKVAINLKNKAVDSIASGETKDCAINILQSNNRLGLIESRATDNTEVISAVLNLAESSGKTVRILSPNRMMTNDINENIKRKPSNLWQWLVSLGKPELGESIAGFKHKYKEEAELPLLRFRQGKDVVIVNSAETLGSNDMHSLLALTEKTNAKIIFLQDLNARQGFSAGNAIDTLKQAGIETFKINAPARESKFTPELRAVQDNSDRTKQLAKAYALKEDKERDNTTVFLGSKEQLKATNDAIRKELKHHGRLSGIEHGVSVLNPIYMSRPESTIAHRYQKNMVIRFYNTGCMHEDWKVDSINKEKNTLRLMQGSKRMLWNPKKQKTRNTNHIAFKQENLAIATGDKLVATGNMHDLGIKNATKFIVQEVDEKCVKLLSSNTVTTIGVDNLRGSHLQYDYATTLSKSSKKPSGHVLADIKAYALDKTTMRELTGRAKDSLTIFTNDVAVAQKRFGYMPIKLTATETLLSAGRAVDANQIDRLINNKTITEIKEDIVKTIAVLGNQQELEKNIEKKSVDFAIEKITSHNAGFTHKELVAEALSYAIREHTAIHGNTVTHDDVMKVIADKRASGELVMGKYFDDGTRWTTKEILEQERLVINDIKKGQNKLVPLLEPKTAKELIEKTTLTQDQKNACHLITTSKDQFVIIQGYAGTGKTTMFSHVQNMLKNANGAKENIYLQDKPEYVSKSPIKRVVNKEQITIEAKAQGEENKKMSQIKEGVTMLALAPTHRAVKELKNIGIEAQTLKSFLVEQQKEGVNSKDNNHIGTTGLDNVAVNQASENQSYLDNKVIILDEASMVSNKDFAQFLRLVGSGKGHVVLSGDIAQHIAVGSGKPFEIAQRSNVLQTAYLREIVRQKNPNLKEVVENVIHGDYASAFKKIEAENPQKHIKRIKPDLSENVLGGKNKTIGGFFNTLDRSIVEIDNNKLGAGEKTLEEMVAEDFLSRAPETQDQTVVIAHSNYDRRVITDFIRKGLKKQGDIAQQGKEVSCLIPKGLTDTEHKSLQYYNVGDVVKFGREYHHVIASDPLSKSLILKDSAGKTKYFYPEKYVDKYNVALYEHTKAELAVGDNIRLTKTDKKRGLYANFEYKVKAVNQNGVALEAKDACLKNNRPEVVINPKELKDAHWDYAQTVTGYGIQGGSKPYAIDFEVSFRKNLANQRSFYIGASRAVKHLAIYTDNKEKLLNRILSNKGDKYAALEVAGDLPASNNNILRNDVAKDRITKEIKTKGQTKDSSISGFYDVKRINQLLSNSAESFVERFLGSPNKKLSSASQWRYGNKGSLVIDMSGDKKGLWHNFETGESGNLLALIQKETGLSFRDTLKYAANMFSLGSRALVPGRKKEEQAKTSSLEATGVVVSKESKTSEYAQKLASESMSITNTLAEKYLKEVRGINNIESDDIRYHPKVYTGKNTSAGKQKYLPAMLAIGRDKDGKIQCVQATYLDPKTANKANIDIQKRTYASPAGASVSLQKHKNGAEISLNDINKNNKISLFAEGIETGLSIKDSVKNSDVMATLGKSNFANINPKDENIGQKVIFCLDNDGTKSFTDNAIHKAAQRLIEHGKEVFIAIPSQINNKKTDFNDVAKSAGIDAVKSHINTSIPYHEWKNTIGDNINNLQDIGAIHAKFIANIDKKELDSNNILYNKLMKTHDIDLNKAVSFISSEQKNNMEKNLISYKEMQSNLNALNQPLNKNKPDLNIQEAQKSLTKIEKEIY